jgi:hypothetical protein
MQLAYLRHKLSDSIASHRGPEGAPMLAAELITHPGFRTAALGEVTWCRKLNGSSFRKYGIGIRFYMHD